MIYTAHEQKGYFCKDVQVFVNRKLRYMPYAQAVWRERKLGARESALEMYSYSSLIFTANFDCGVLCDISIRDADAYMNFSRTTSAQVTKAMREIGLTDSTIARLKKWFTGDSKHVTAVYTGRGKWVDADNGEVIC